MKFWNDVKAVIAAPFGGDEIDMTHLFLLVGMILIFISAWLLILKHVRDAAMEIV